MLITKITKSQGRDEHLVGTPYDISRDALAPDFMKKKKSLKAPCCSSAHAVRMFFYLILLRLDDQYDNIKRQLVFVNLFITISSFTCQTTHLLSRSQDDALRTGVPCGLVVVVGAGCSGSAGQSLDSLSLSSLGSGMLPMPVEALPIEWFLRWLNSDMLEERE